MNSINGIPAHPLLVHLVVVAIPAAALLGVVAVIWPRARRWLAWAPAAVALVAVIATPITTSAGEALNRHTRRNPELLRHAQLGDQMIYWIAPLFVAITLFTVLYAPWFARFVTPLPPTATRIVSVALSVAVVVLAVGSVVWVYRIGDAGARSVWVN